MINLCNYFHLIANNFFFAYVRQSWHVEVKAQQIRVIGKQLLGYIFVMGSRTPEKSHVQLFNPEELFRAKFFEILKVLEYLGKRSSLGHLKGI